MSVAAPLLLDVNVLVALAWPTHQFHRAATSRLEREPSRRWATCALTQLGFVRVSSNPRVMGVGQTPVAALALLTALTADSKHVFIDRLPAIDSASDLVDRIVGHQQVTDAYLIAVARKHQATLLTFDSRLAAVDGGGRQVEVLG